MKKLYFIKYTMPGTSFRQISKHSVLREFTKEELIAFYKEDNKIINSIKIIKCD